MNSITSIRRYTFDAILIGLFLAAAGGAYAQVSTINSAVITPRVFDDVTNAIGTYINLYPGSITLGESGMSQATGNEDRDVWQFSNNGSTAYYFGNSDYFTASMTMTLSGNDTSIGNEAGFLFSTASEGDIQLIANSPGHFLGQFGGISYWNSGTTYALGNTVTLGLSYFLDTATGDNALQFFANTNASPVFDFAPGVGIGAGSTLGGYYQIQNDPANSINSGSAIYSGISITPSPEPSTFAFLSMGIGALGAVVLRRRRRI